MKKSKYRFTLEHLEALLRRKEFRIREYALTKAEQQDPTIPKAYKNIQMAGRCFSHTFHKWMTTYNRVPTPAEFTCLQFNDVLKNLKRDRFRAKQGIILPMSVALEKTIKNRILRGYKSIIIEIHTQLQLERLYPKCKLISNEDLDRNGVDILMHDIRKNIYVNMHVTSWTGMGTESLLEKGGKQITFKNVEGTVFSRPIWGKTSRSNYNKRDFTGHTFLTYYNVRNKDDRIFMVNGYPFFQDEYLKMKVDFKLKRIKTGK